MLIHRSVLQTDRCTGMHTNTYGNGNKIIVSVILFRYSLVNHFEVDNDSFKKETFLLSKITLPRVYIFTCCFFLLAVLIIPSGHKQLGK